MNYLRFSLLFITALFLYFLYPGLSIACPNYLVQTGQEVKNAYYLTAGILMFLPPGIIASIFLWVKSLTLAPNLHYLAI